MNYKEIPLRLASESKPVFSELKFCRWNLLCSEQVFLLEIIDKKFKLRKFIISRPMIMNKLALHSNAIRQLSRNMTRLTRILLLMQISENSSEFYSLYLFTTTVLRIE